MRTPADEPRPATIFPMRYLTPTTEKAIAWTRMKSRRNF
jgi:hypothetical protein